ncbi:MAG: SDR family NAD(P)-dependent oxidoreductase [Rhodospirillaceae bacterium]
MRHPQTILITGASSGLGAALARVYAEPGVVLALTGRDSPRLEAVAAVCRYAGAQTETALIDVRDRDRMERWIREIDARRPIDLMIANAGISAGTAGGSESVQQIRQTFGVNIEGVLNTVLPAVEVMKERGRGQIALVSSLASFRGFPGAAGYCASKAAERVLGEGLRGELAPLGVEVSVICPGFIRTPLTAKNGFAMPYLMEPARAAVLIKRGLARNQGRIAFPWQMYHIIQLFSILPQRLIDLLLRLGPR